MKPNIYAPSTYRTAVRSAGDKYTAVDNACYIIQVDFVLSTSLAGGFHRSRPAPPAVTGSYKEAFVSYFQEKKKKIMWNLGAALEPGKEQKRPHGTFALCCVPAHMAARGHPNTALAIETL